jgi:general secretion pathway protein G
MRNVRTPARNGFTLVELLVVSTIIVLLASAAFVSYGTINRNSLDAKRRADLEQIRAAIEMYRSNNDTYPTTLSVTCATAGDAFASGGVTYLGKLPGDPKCTASTYYYTATADDYTLAAELEGSDPGCASAPGGSSCGTGNPCNYCLGPYGEK